MKDIVLPIWGALIASGWWAFALWRNTDLAFGTGVLSFGLLIYLGYNIVTNWD